MVPGFITEFCKHAAAAVASGTPPTSSRSRTGDVLAAASVAKKRPDLTPQVYAPQNPATGTTNPELGSAKQTPPPPVWS